jgi:hypothetical protein
LHISLLLIDIVLYLTKQGQKGNQKKISLLEPFNRAFCIEATAGWVFETLRPGQWLPEFRSGTM